MQRKIIQFPNGERWAVYGGKQQRFRELAQGVVNAQINVSHCTTAQLEELHKLARDGAANKTTYADQAQRCIEAMSDGQRFFAAFQALLEFCAHATSSRAAA